MSWGAIASAVISGVASYAAARSQQKAAKTQAEAAEQSGQEQLAIAREQIAFTKPLRDLALEQGNLSIQNQKQLLPLLRQEFGQEALTSPQVQRFLERGREEITRGTISALAPFGLEDSSVSGRAIGEGIGEFTTNVGLQELLNRRNLGLSLAGLNPIPGGYGTAGLDTAAQLQFGASQSNLLAGQSIAAGQLGAGQTYANYLGGLSGLFQGTGQTVNSGGPALQGQQQPAYGLILANGQAVPGAIK